jgi:hypothetical protein
MTGSCNNDDQNCALTVHEGACIEDEITVLRSKNQQLQILCNDLKHELSVTKNQSMHVNGVQSGLQIRLNEQDNNVLQMKSEILQLNMTIEQISKEKAEILMRLDEHIRLVNDIKV